MKRPPHKGKPKPANRAFFEGGWLMYTGAKAPSHHRMPGSMRHRIWKHSRDNKPVLSADVIKAKYPRYTATVYNPSGFITKLIEKMFEEPGNLIVFSPKPLSLI